MPSKNAPTPHLISLCSSLQLQAPHVKVWACPRWQRLAAFPPTTLTQNLTLEHLNGRYVLCCLRDKALTYMPVVQDLNVCSTYETFNQSLEGWNNTACIAKMSAPMAFTFNLSTAGKSSNSEKWACMSVCIMSEFWNQPCEYRRSRVPLTRLKATGIPF